MKTIMKKTILMIAAIMIQMAAMAEGRMHDCNTPEKKKMTPEERLDEHIKFVVKMLELDDATAAKFTPVYKEYMKEKRNLRIAGITKRKEQKDKITEAEAAKIVRERLQLSRKLLDVREKYYTKFGKIITAIQVKKIYDMEQNLDMKMRKKHDNRQSGGDRAPNNARMVHRR